jgi:Tfp pilus assembly protein PilN
MPSVNLIWEQRALREKNRKIAIGMMACIGLVLGLVVADWARTRVNEARCNAEIAKCQQTIQANAERARQNRDLQAEIAALEPTLLLLQEAQRMTLRWVQLLGEMHRCVPNPEQVALHQLNYAVAAAAAAAADKKDTKDLIGNLTLSGTARSYPLISATMRRLATQRHVGDVRLTQAQVEERGEAESAQSTVRFTMTAQFRIPKDEEKVMVAAAEAQSQGGDYSGTLQKAGENTVLNRVPADAAAGQP